MATFESPERPEIERVAADATDSARLSELAKGAVALYNCANPPYHQWLTDWPPLSQALLRAAETSGAVLATACNVYGYGPVAGRITDTTPLAATQPKLKLRADMWRDALAAHAAGKIRATEVRASDYIEANSIFSFMLAKPLLACRARSCPRTSTPRTAGRRSVTWRPPWSPLPPRNGHGGEAGWCRPVRRSPCASWPPGSPN